MIADKDGSFLLVQDRKKALGNIDQLLVVGFSLVCLLASVLKGTDKFIVLFPKKALRGKLQLQHGDKLEVEVKQGFFCG